MLVLTRKVGERVVLGGDVVLTVLSVAGGRIRLGIEAPPGVSVWREELLAPAKGEALVGIGVDQRPDNSCRPPPKG